MRVCLLIGALAVLIPAVPSPRGLRERFVRGSTIFAAVLLLGTELLGAFGLLHAEPVAFWWIAVAAIGLPFAWRRRRTSFVPPVFDAIAWLAIAGIVVILGITAFTAALSPPNSADAMAYHMPRLLYWAEQGSVRFFPTAYLNQIMLQPLAEYFMLHLYLLGRGDGYINFVQWFGWFGSITVVSLIAKRFGAGRRGQALAALFCATLPSGILASTGAKNDCLLAFWMAACTYFALEYVATQSLADALFFGAALGLALLTKATAYLFLPLILLAIFTPVVRRLPVRKWLPGAVLACVVALIMNAPHFTRNYQLSGSVLGFDSAQGDGFFRWRNETFGWKQTISNLLRNASEQIGMRSERWNSGVYNAVLSAHRELGIDPEDPATTWRWSHYFAPKNANHEADRGNPWHLAFLVLAFCILLYRAGQGNDRGQLIYAAALAGAVLIFCVYLKWQPFMARLFLPLFVLGSPLAALFARGPKTASAISSAALCFLLLDGTRHPLLDNWTRPLRGPDSILHTSRDSRYFADMTPWKNADAFRRSVDALAGAKCGLVGVDITDFQLEYPLEALLRERVPAISFVHTGVDNASNRFAPSVTGEPCAIVCLECATDKVRLGRYSIFSSTENFDRFVVLLRQDQNPAATGSSNGSNRR